MMTLRMTDSPNVYRWAEKQREKQREKENTKQVNPHMGSLFSDLQDSLEEAIEHEEGKETSIKVQEVEDDGFITVHPPLDKNKGS